MKITVFTDLEGASGVFTFAQTRDRKNPLYREAVEYLMGDIAAVVKGLRAAGVKDILVLDSHGGGNNFIPHLMAPGARYITGNPPCKEWGLDKTCAGLILLGYHARWGTPDGVLYHTQCSVSESRYWYNGVASGELAQHALYAGHFGVPPIMVSGDEATCREARKFFGKSCVAVAVKKGLTREAAVLYPFEETRQALYEGARRAVAAISRCRPYKVRLPIRAKAQGYAVEQHPSQTRLVTRSWIIKDLSDLKSIV